MMKIVCFIAFFCTFCAFTQVPAETPSNQKTNLGERGLNRYFIDGIVGGGFLFGYGVHAQDESGIIFNFRMGNNFYLGKGKHPMILRLTYIRLGSIANTSNHYAHIIPPQLGLIKHFRLNETTSIEPGIHCGYIIKSDLPFDGFESFGLGVLYEIKFNIKRFCVGIEYGTRKDIHQYPVTYYSPHEIYHYFGFSLGSRFGSR